MLAELWTRDRNRSMSLVATSHRRRSVRSRRHHTSPSMGGLPTRLAPISSTSFQPVGVLTRSSMGEPTVLSRTLSSEATASSRSSGCRNSSALSPTMSALDRPKIRSAAGIAPHQVALGVGHDDGVGQLQGQMLQPRRFHCPFPKAALQASARREAFCTPRREGVACRVCLSCRAHCPWSGRQMPAPAPRVRGVSVESGRLTPTARRRGPTGMRAPPWDGR